MDNCFFFLIYCKGSEIDCILLYFEILFIGKYIDFMFVNLIYFEYVVLLFRLSMFIIWFMVYKV